MKVIKKRNISRLLSYVLAVALMFGLMPGMVAKAADKELSIQKFMEGESIGVGKTFTIKSGESVYFNYYEGENILTETLEDAETYTVGTSESGGVTSFTISGNFSSTTSNTLTVCGNPNNTYNSIIATRGAGTSESPFTFVNSSGKPVIVKSFRSIYEGSWNLAEGDRIEPTVDNKYHNYTREKTLILSTGKKYVVASSLIDGSYYFYFVESGTQAPTTKDDAICYSKNQDAHFFICSNNQPDYIYDFKVSGQIEEEGGQEGGQEGQSSENEKAFEAEKTTQKAAADALLKSDDSDACKKLVEDAKKNIDDTKYDTSKTLDDNKKVLAKIVTDLKTALEEQRKKDAATGETDTVVNPDGTKTVTEVKKDSTGGTEITVTDYNKDGSELSQYIYNGASGENLDLRTVNYSGKKIVVPDTVTGGGKTYKVTRIRKNFMKKCKTATKVDIGSNVKIIDKGAFNGGKKVKTIVLRGKLKKVGKGAFKALKKGAIKIKASYKVYKHNVKLLERSGLDKNIKIKRIKK